MTRRVSRETIPVLSSGIRLDIIDSEPGPGHEAHALKGLRRIGRVTMQTANYTYRPNSQLLLL